MTAGQTGPECSAEAAIGPLSPDRPRRRYARLLPVITVVITVAVSCWSLERVPDASWGPALLGLLPWVVGKYVLCPLRWHALSCAGRSRRWYLRSYAESELLGLASPGHVGADLWRAHRLQSDAGLRRTSALTEVGLDRLVGAVGLATFVLVAGATLPLPVLGVAVAVGAILLLIGLGQRARCRRLLRAHPWPSRRVLLRGVALSMGYQLTIVGLLVGTTSAMAAEVDPVLLLGVFGASQAAGIVPGVSGASPREGALVVGLAAIGVPWDAALGAVALTSLLAWGPGLLLGGACLLARRAPRRIPVPA